MGNCIFCRKRDKVQILPEGNHLTYPRTISYNIRPQTNDKSIASEIRVQYPDPFKTSFTQKQIGQFNFQVSGCILPNFDPRGEIKKQCQDNYFILDLQGSMIIGLFDGHGPKGHEVAQFAIKYMKGYYEQLTLKQQNWEEILINSFETCDQSLKQQAIDTATSGTTGIIIIIKENQVHIGSVGDSRTVLGTEDQLTNLTIKQISECEENELVNPIRLKRQIQKHKNLNSYQLTQDQKPNFPQEMQRILQFGGCVQKIQNDQNEEMGPYRVWRKDQQTPGLAMSRSIGDSIAKELGVISTPITLSKQILQKDKLIISGSDGLWDVICNQESVNFAQTYKDFCIKGEGTQSSHYISPNCVNIGQLLAEEARLRWRGIIEQEDIPIDDITCIVIEISQGSNQERITPSILDNT